VPDLGPGSDAPLANDPANEHLRIL
jgi:hypothetical protein